MSQDTSGKPDPLSESAEELYEEAPFGYLSALPDGTVIRANRRIASMLGRPDREWVGQVRVQKLLTVGGQIYYETHVAPLLLMQGFVEEIALELTRAQSPVPVPVLMNAVLLRNPAGEPRGIRATLIDATGRRRYERELLSARHDAEEATRAKSKLVSMLSHDLRTPLGALTTVGDLLERTPLTEDQTRYVRILKSSTANLKRLIDEVLDLGKLEAGRMSLDSRSADLRAIVEGLVDELRVEADRKGLGLRLAIDSELPASLQVDAIKVGRILSNLLGNAIKFTEHGEVSVALTVLRSDESRALLGFRVHDTGIGITDDQMDRIFDDFTQGSDEIGRRFGGSGLGLGICKKLLTLYGTTLTVESRPGLGSTFSFELDLEK